MGYRWLVSSVHTIDTDNDRGYRFETRTARSVVGLVRALLDVRCQGEALILIEWRAR